MKKPKKQKTKKQKTFDKAWRYFSRYIRRRDKYICFTCGERGNHAGHFKHGKSNENYFNEKNVHCQCIKCNFFYNGNLAVYLRNMQKKYGVKESDKLLNSGGKVKRWGIKELEDIAQKYKKKCENMY